MRVFVNMSRCRCQIIGLTLALWGGQVSATDQGHGVVTMRGEILDSACSIDTASRDQTIDMLSQPISEIISENMGLERPFSIRLVNCVLERYSTGSLPVDNWQYFKVTFDGQHDHGDFGISGLAQGIALQIRDAEGSKAIPGKALPAHDIKPDSMTLNYSIRLVGNADSLEPGAYHTTIRYKLDYY